MRVRFWGTRGSLPVAQRPASIAVKIARALMIARGRKFETEAEAESFALTELDFATHGTYGGATSCIEIEGGDDDQAFVICDMGSGLREFGINALRRCAEGHPRVYHFFLSHLHWDHIMGFPYFRPAYESGAIIVIHSGHPDAEAALRRQQEAMSFAVPFDALKAHIEFRRHSPGEAIDVGGLRVTMIRQTHAGDSFGYRFERGGQAVIYSTDAEHKPDEMDAEGDFETFFAGADLVVCDTMYSLADMVSLRQDSGHSSNIVAVDLCLAGGAKRLALFHHEPSYSDEDILRMHDETIRYENVVRAGRPRLEVICAYDGLEVTL
ncbi:MAG TPA: MBL fold metallo-hydrolase [Caulobacteraceae bacterium]|jgi:phosphoribosyl 1,2-cyclic phosphodiesterase